MSALKKPKPTDGELVADALKAVATQVKHLGVGDAAWPMGALECVAAELRDGLNEVASSIRTLAEAIREAGDR